MDRDSCWSNPSCPGTNRRVTTRDLSAAMWTGLRRARLRGLHRHRSKTLTEDRACCSVERRASVDSVPWLRLAPSILQAVKGAAGCGVPHDDPRVVVTEKPIGGSGDPVRPPSVAVNSLGAGTGIGQRRHLNGLLVESRAVVVGTTASRGGDREMAVSVLAVEQPFQEVQSALQEDRTLERGARRRSSLRGGWRWRRSGAVRATATPMSLTGSAHCSRRHRTEGRGQTRCRDRR